MATFKTEIKVRFQHTDPAGILFYPRYFEMLNQVMEEWFDRELGYDYRSMTIRDKNGVPAVHVEADFKSPSDLGDLIEFTLVVEHLGRSSCRVRVVGVANGQVRLSACLTVAFASMVDRKAQPWPTDVKERIQKFIEESGAEAAS